MPFNQRSSLWLLLHLSIMIGAIFLSYLPGINGGFYFDDYPNLVHNAKLGITNLSYSEINKAAHSSQSGPTGRPIAMASFAINHYFAKFNPLPYKITNIVIHIFNTLLVFLTVLLLTQSALSEKLLIHSKRIALFGAAWWGLHPLGISSVLYIVQRMNSLATLFSLLAIIAFIYTRIRLHLNISYLLLMLISILSFGLLAIYSKETALLLPLFILLIEFCFFAEHLNTPRYWYILRLIAVVIVIGSGAFWLVQNVFTSNWREQVYALRLFSMEERILTQSRILWTYWQFILLPNIQYMGLHLDDVVLSKSLFNPISTLFAIIGHILLCTIAIILRKKHRILTFGILWFYIGHLLESTLFPLELMYEHRNYLPMIGPIYAATYYGYFGLARASARLKPVLYFSSLILLLSLGIATATRAVQWGDQWEMPFIEAAHHPYSTRANFFAGRACGELMTNSQSAENKKYLFNCALKYLNQSALVNRRAPEPMIALGQLYVSAKQPIPQYIINELKHRLSNNALGNDGAYLGKGLLDLGLADEKIISDHSAKDLFLSTLSNKKLSGTNKAHVLVSYGMLLCDGLQECSNAIPVFEEAVHTSSDIQFMVVLSTYYLRVGQTEKALLMIHKALNADSNNIFESDLKNLERHALLFLRNNPKSHYDLH